MHRLRLDMLVAGTALGAGLARAPAAAQSPPDALALLGAAASTVRAATPHAALRFAPGSSWRADTLRASTFLALLGLLTPRSSGAAAEPPCGPGETGSPAVAGARYRVGLGRPTFVRVDSATVDVSLSCENRPPRRRTFARDERLTFKRAMPGGTWRLVGRWLTRIT